MSEPKLPTSTEMKVLELLATRAQMYGLEMVRENSSLKRGTIYVLLGRLEDKGFVRSWQEERESDRSGMPRRLYAITGLGQQAYKTVSEYRADAPALGWEGA